METTMRSKIPQQGNNNFTEVDGDRVLKKPSTLGASMLEATYEQQVKQWNKYYEGTIYATACITDDGRLSTPYIDGSYPTDKQRLAICEEMMQKGFIMVDCRDKRNFLVNKEGIVFPVDFGQVHTQENRFYNTHSKVVQREIDSIKAKLQKPQQRSTTIFSSLKKPPHENLFQDVEVYILELEKYKEKLEKLPEDKINIDKINGITLFVVDTRDRINQYNQGNKNAFDGYIEANEKHLEVLATNRATRPMLYSIILTLMVVPAIVGFIQLAITKGNSYLFLTGVKESEKRAKGVQTKLIETKESLSKEKKGSSEETAKPAYKGTF